MALSVIAEFGPPEASNSRGKDVWMLERPREKSVEYPVAIMLEEVEKKRQKEKRRGEALVSAGYDDGEKPSQWRRNNFMRRAYT